MKDRNLPLAFFYFFNFTAEFFNANDFISIFFFFVKLPLNKMLVIRTIVPSFMGYDINFT
jgi:hypothetical protein